MLQKIFDMENGFMRGLARVTDLVILNVLFLLCCIPIVTAGASLAALYSMTLKMVRNEEPYIIRGFFKAFKENLKQGMILGAVVLVVIVAAGMNLILFRNVKAGIFVGMKVVCIAIIILTTFLSLYIFPIISRFEMTAKEILRNGFLICIAHLPKTFFMLAMYIPVVMMMLYSEITMLLLLSVYIVFGFSAMAFLQSFILRNVFEQYEPKAEEKERTDLEK